VPLRCRQGQRLRVNDQDQVDVDDHGLADANDEDLRRPGSLMRKPPQLHGSARTLPLEFLSAAIE